MVYLKEIIDEPTEPCSLFVLRNGVVDVLLRSAVVITNTLVIAYRICTKSSVETRIRHLDESIARMLSQT
jgi:hypothetical protein